MPARKNIMKAVATKIYKKNSKFSKPSGVTSVTVEQETYPTKLPSQYTPSALKLTELYKSGYEPSEVSSRFDTLANPTNGKSTFNGSTITISWDPISTPGAIDPIKIEEMYNDTYWKFFEKYKSEFYQNHITYNTNNLGSVGYQIYLQDSTGNLTSLGYTTNTNFTYPANASVSDYKFVVKSAYNIFKDNMSSGLTITAEAKIDDNIGNIGGPSDPDNPLE